MEQAIPKLIEMVLGYGLPGAIILYLIYERKVLQDQIKDLLAALSGSQESRIKEARETTGALETVKDVLDVLKDFMRGKGGNNG